MNVKEDYVWKTKTGIRNNHLLLPRNIRGLIVGKSNCGKTTLLLVRFKARVAMIFVNIYHPTFSLFWKILMFFDSRPLFFTFYRYFVVGIVFYVEQKCIYL